jgi:hypothetical protein
MDCTAGAFRDFNALAHLMKYSPSTKFIFMVRDPFQRLASWLLMNKRALAPERYDRFYRVWMSALRKSQFPRATRYNSSTLHSLMGSERYISSFLYAEVLHHWMAGVPPERLLVIDHFNLEEKPLQVMRAIESYLSLAPQSYDLSALLSVSTNVGLLPDDDDGHLTGHRNQTPSSRGLQSAEPSPLNVTRSHPIHAPYLITDKTLLTLSRHLFWPSLCLFKQMFGWSVRITTESELEAAKRNDNRLL